MAVIDEIKKMIFGPDMSDVNEVTVPEMTEWYFETTANIYKVSMKKEMVTIRKSTHFHRTEHPETVYSLMAAYEREQFEKLIDILECR